MDPDQLLDYVDTEIHLSYGAVYMITRPDETIMVDFDMRNVYLEYSDDFFITFDFDDSLKAITIRDDSGDFILSRLTPGSAQWVSEVNFLLNLIDIIQRSHQAEVLDRIKQKLTEAQ